jgi:hypothetical protein
VLKRTEKFRECPTQKQVFFVQATGGTRTVWTGADRTERWFEMRVVAKQKSRASEKYG